MIVTLRTLALAGAVLVLPTVAVADGETPATETSTAAAAETTEPEPTAEDGEPGATFEGSVTVTTPAPGYVATNAVSALKSAAPLAETPQAVAVVTAERIRDLAAAGLQDALGYSAGVRSDAFGLDSRTDSMLVRGAYPDEYLDGLRQNFNWYTSTTRTDPYLLERVEVLRGPASVLYGQGTTGGIVNMVSKLPLGEERREVVVSTGSFDRMQLQTDLTGPLDENGRWRFRLVALGRESDTQVDHVFDDRYLVAPSLTWLASERTHVTFQLRWQQDRSGSTLQFFPWSGTGAANPNGAIPTDNFLGEPGFDRYDSERASAGWQLEHGLSERWTLRQSVRFARNEVDYRSLYADAFSAPGDSFLDPDQRQVGRYLWISQPKVEIWNADQHVEGSFATGPIRHQLLIGVDALGFEQTGRSGFDFPEHLGGGVPAIDVYDPVPTGVVVPELAADRGSTQDQLGLYVQDRMRFGERWIVVAGGRHDRVESGLEGGEDEEDDATTARVALLWTGPGGFAPYASWSESFTPVPGTDLFGRRFEPLAGEQVEVGVKLAPDGSRWSASAAAFELRESNRLVADPTNPLNQVQAGRTETSGVELELLGDVGAGFDVAAHYNYLHNDAQLDAVPEHQAALWLRRGFTLGPLGDWTAGLGVRWFDAFRDGAAPEVPELALFDALLAWEHGDWRLAANVANLEDERYVSTCLARGDCFYGARRTLTLSAGRRF